MKKSIILTFLLFIAAYSYGQIELSAHDFSEETWAPSSNKMCSVCHTTHNASSIDDAPLWNHEITAAAAYTTYNSATFDGVGTIGDPSASSKLCLSCHDGTVALESFGGVTGSEFIAEAYRIGGGGAGNNVSNDHPISFDYTTALLDDDDGLFDPATALSGLGGTITQDMLFNNELQCASCHDVHNKYGELHLLKMDNTNSELCLTCHDK